MIAVDLGNTKTAIGLFREGILTHKWKFETNPNRTTDDIRFLLQTCLNDVNESFKTQSALILSSVVPEATRQWEKLSNVVDVHLVTSKTPISFSIALAEPQTLGSDRIADAEAAIRKFQTPMILVGAGTAISVSAINEKKEFLGGAIAPGLGISLEALFLKAARLSQIDLTTPERAIGTSTKKAIESGIHYGYASLIHGLVDQFQKEMNWKNASVIATGGSLERLRPFLRKEIIIEDNLTLEGLHSLYQNLTQRKPHA